jgi:hypothetical protein
VEEYLEGNEQIDELQTGAEGLQLRRFSCKKSYGDIAGNIKKPAIKKRSKKDTLEQAATL